ncbi:hypothetical protein TPMD03_15 [Thiohalocapsa phage LS06-2018-MD03]|nr:hypothetical protein TPMD03_15 [Thiohalocapsa phage LS06-2018-MD03]
MKIPKVFLKVIKKDNLDRDFRPEQLITTSISNDTAVLIADTLNQRNDGFYYFVEEDDYRLDLQSMYDVTDESIPESFYINQFGLKALVNEFLLEIEVAKNDE